MTIYVRNEEGKLTSLEVLTLKGEKGQDGANGKDGITPNVQIGNVTTLEPGEQATVTRRGTNENPVFNFGIPRGQDGTGGNGASIDDNTVSTDKTWSSAKIEDFVLTNDNTIWSDVNGENLSIEHTKEGYLREVEILGNTWQDSDGKNLVNNNDGYILKMYDRNVLNHKICDIEKSKMKVGVKYTLSSKTEINSNMRLNLYGVKDGEPKNLYQIYSVASGTLTLNSEYDEYFLSAYALKDTEVGYKLSGIQLEEGAIATPYEPYHKADLSDIQHLGELYVDDDGKPKLDSQGRKQYKIDVSVSNTILTDWEDYELLPGRFWNGKIESGWVQNIIKKQHGFSFEVTGSTTRGVVIKNVKGAGKGTYTVEFEMTKETIAWENKAFTNINTFKNEEFVEQANSNQVISIKENRGYLEFNLTKDFDYLWLSIGTASGDGTGVYAVNNVNLYKGSYKNINKQPSQIKTTILTPCQLMKVGDAADRLYWDSSKGRYVVEKNIDKAKIEVDFSKVQPFNQIFLGIQKSLSQNFNCGWLRTKALTSHLKYSGWSTNPKDTKYGVGIYGDGDTRIYTKTDEVLDIDEMKGMLEEGKYFYVYGKLQTPQLIETNITEELKIPTYINNTYISVSGGIQGSIKAKAPVDGGKVIKTLQRENIEIKATNDKQDELINVIMLATDEMFMILEPLLPEAIDLNERSTSNIADMYIAMVQRGIKTTDEVPVRYREQVKQTLE